MAEYRPCPGCGAEVWSLRLTCWSCGRPTLPKAPPLRGVSRPTVGRKRRRKGVEQLALEE